MRRSYCTITPPVVRQTAHDALKRALPWRKQGRLVTVGKLLDLLLLTASLVSSLSAVVRRFRFGFSHETARQAVEANLPQQQPLTEGLLDALYALAPQALWRRPWVVAMDLHNRPFYGDRSPRGIVGGQKKHGTKYSYAYATAAIVHHRQRWTVGLVAVTGSQKPHQIVSALLAQMRQRGLRLRGVVLDSGFDSGETLLQLQEQHLAYTVPLRKKGKGKTRRNVLWDHEVGTVTEAAWQTEKTRQPVRTPVVVVQRPREKDKKVYAFGGWQAPKARHQVERARLAKRWYRKRFGIESSYRQMNQSLALTTKKDVRYRLLLVGLGLLLRQAWVWLTREIARDQQLRPTKWVEELPLARLLGWLADCLKAKYKEDKEIHFTSPILLELGTTT